MKRAAFLDRDGVINRKAPEGQYITRWEEMDFLPGVPEAIKQLNQAGFLVIVISNQRCVAKGLVTAAGVEDLHRRMSEHMAQRGARIDAVYYCPHELQPVCACRKPAPGMLLQAAGEHAIDLAASWMIGDSDIDVEAGRNAGCHTALLRAGGREARLAADVVAPSLLEAIDQIVEHDRVFAGRP